MQGERERGIRERAALDTGPSEPRVLGRRFEAVVLWSTDPNLSTRTARDLTRYVAPVQLSRGLPRLPSVPWPNDWGRPPALRLPSSSRTAGPPAW